MTRRDDHFDAMLRHLGATYYHTLHGEATPSDVARALDSIEREAARRGAPQRPAHGRGHRSGRWRVHDVMTTSVISVDRWTPVRRIARLMTEHHIHAVPVVSGGQRVIGVVSEFDLLSTQQQRRPFAARLARGHGGPTAPATTEGYTAERLMTSPAITIHPDAPIGVAARRMADHHLTLLPVVSPEGDLIGVVSRRDLLGIFLRADEDIAAEVRGILTDVLLIDPDEVTVAVTDGAVTLTGEVARAELSELALRLAGQIDGVLSVEDHLSTPPQAASG